MNTTPSTHEKGDHGENLAVEYLLNRGYRIVCRNYRAQKGGEIDCIAYDTNGTLVFIEVKASRSNNGKPLFWVTPAKQRTLFRMAQRYLAEHKLTDVACRFDVIGIKGNTIDHLRNAFIRM